MRRPTRLKVRCMARACDLWREDQAASAAEYAILATFVALALVAGAQLLGLHLSSFFYKLAQVFH